MAETDELLLNARALVLQDLNATGAADAGTVSVLEAAVTARRWWLEEWPEGRDFVAGLVAQDVQDQLLDSVGRWPLCPRCVAPPHPLYIHPDLGGPDPAWVCEETAREVARLGELGGRPQSGR